MMKYQKGIIALPTMVALAFIVMVIALLMTGAAYIQSRISKINSQSIQSFYLSESGGENALLRVARNKTITQSSQSNGIDNSLKTDITNSGTLNSRKTIDVQSSWGNQYTGLQLIIDLDENGKITSYHWEKTQ